MALIGQSDTEKTDYILARNQILPRFRHRICERLNITPFEHQAAWWAASDGLILTPHEARDDDPPETYRSIRLPDRSIVKRRVLPRSRPARFIANLTAYKTGKSLGSAIWAAAYAIVQDAKIELVGLEYDTCAPEFEYLIEILLSDRGLGLKARSVQNRPRDGKMWIDLDNGVQYIARSWERKDAMKGKERDAYIMCEAYQLPGIEVFTSNKQNLDARRGSAIFPTTPDRPWVIALHELGHDANEPDWDCFCNVPRSANPYTFDPEAAQRDKKTMTRERYQIHYGGQIGEFVALDGGGEGIRDDARGIHADIGQQQASFDFFQDRGVDLLFAEEQIGEPAGQTVAGPVQPLAQALPYPARGGGCGFRRGAGHYLAGCRAGNARIVSLTLRAPYFLPFPEKDRGRGSD